MRLFFVCEFFFSCYLARGDVVIVCVGKGRGLLYQFGLVVVGGTDRERERERGGQERERTREIAFPRSDPSIQHARPPLAGW
jgi:hypothetical protein